MNDYRPPDAQGPAQPEPDEALSAYLLGDLEDGAAAAFEAWLAADAGLRARLDALAGALAALGGVDDVDEPDGFAERLGARLAAERDVADLSARRERRRRWSAVLTAAAGVVVLAVAGLQVTTGGPPAPRDERVAREMAAGDDAAVEQAAGEALLESDGMELESGAGSADAYRAPEPMADGDGGAAGVEETAADGPADSAGGGSGGAPSMAAADDGQGPAIVDEGASLDDDDQLRARYEGAPESERFRGLPREDAAEVAARHADQVRAADAFASGARPDRCLDEVGAERDGRIVTVVERLRWQGGEALAYVLALPSETSATVDRFEAWVMGPQGCDILGRVSWR
ncbi:MAG TPA: hypothetical protein VNU01_11980 [Egibacteraceae bacterium]|nr:hypothetical protein [Egibacteraceae bacterium]